ncbi:type IV secretory system conjugative DNA transfer family protein [Magnetococcus sp. PR-3]|uniref:type IV secretory system conjugative DNA transfer family protein n=1 Tax=Magnetococcus sp. PR-3 TaxID=3120355 RepID=UPI002FCE3059
MKKHVKPDGQRGMIYGSSGSGKSVLMASVIRSWKSERCIIFDPEDMLSGDFQDYDLIEGNIEDFRRYLYKKWNGPFKVIYVPHPSGIPEQLHNFSKVVFQMQDHYGDYRKPWAKPLHVAVDELHEGCPKDMPAKLDGYIQLSKRSRKRGIHLLGATQRPVDVKASARTQAPITYVIGQFHRLDKKELEASVNPDAVSEVEGSPKFHYAICRGNVEYKLCKPAEV